MNRITMARLIPPTLLLVGAWLALAQPAPSNPHGQTPPAVPSSDTPALDRALTSAADLLKKGKAEEVVNLLRPIRAYSDDPRLIALLTEALATAAYDRLASTDDTLRPAPGRENSPGDNPGGNPGADPGAPADQPARRELDRLKQDELRRALDDADRRISQLERSLNDDGRALPITDRLEQSLRDLQRDVQDLGRHIDRVDRAVEQLRYKR